MWERDRYVKPLVYDDFLRQSYSTSSVTGGSLEGKVAFITGAAGGIGKAIVQRLLNEHCRVIMSDISIDKLKAARSKINFEESMMPELFPMDLTDASLAEKVKSLTDSHDIDIWVNCAGVMSQRDKDILFQNDKSLWDKIMQVNLGSAMTATPIVAESMEKRNNSGVIINISSVLCFSQPFGFTSYAISKAGLIKYTERMALLYKDKVSIISIAPGTTVTSMGIGEFRKDITSEHSLTGHLSIPEEIAAVVAFCSGDIAPFITGRTIKAIAEERIC